MINQVTLVGRLTKDPELRLTQDSGIPVTHITLAVSRQFKNHSGQIEADFVQCTLWRKAAENTANYCRKGSIVGVTGRIQSRHYDNNEGRRIYVTEVVAETVQFISKKSISQDHAPIQSQAVNSSSGSTAHQLPGAATGSGTSRAASQLTGAATDSAPGSESNSVSSSQLTGMATGSAPGSESNSESGSQLAGMATGSAPGSESNSVSGSQLTGASTVAGFASETSTAAGTMITTAQVSGSSTSPVTNLVSDSATVLTMSRASNTMASGAIARTTSDPEQAQAHAGLI